MPIKALIPARNEEASIAVTVASVRDQVDLVVVIANNCTDDTAGEAWRAGASVILMPNNTHKKAGALNQALQEPDSDALYFVMDADTVIEPGAIEKCVALLEATPHAGAVGTIFSGRPGGGLLGLLQRNEYDRYARAIERRGNEAFVLSGTASLFSGRALRDLYDRRGYVYDVHGRTEDNEITLALKALGYDTPTADTRSVTDVMTTLAALYAQRERWCGGALDNLRRFGWALPWHCKWLYWRQQAGLLLSLCTATAFFVLALTVGVHLTMWWLIPLGIVSVEKVVSVPTTRQKLLAMAILPEFAYGLFLLGVFAVSLFRFLLGKGQNRWIQT